jgi:hypothetical protein
MAQRGGMGAMGGDGGELVYVAGDADGYDVAMSIMRLRREIKKAVDQIPAERLGSLADYVSFLNRPPLMRRIKDAEKAIAEDKGVNWRKVRRDV